MNPTQRLLRKIKNYIENNYRAPKIIILSDYFKDLMIADSPFFELVEKQKEIETFTGIRVITTRRNKIMEVY